MISISPMKGGVGEYYLNLAREDYYTAGGEPPGRWMGEGRFVLKALGEVENEQLRALLSGHTLQGEKLVRSAGTDKHRAGWDLTFSAPKSVSVIWSQADAATRLVIQDAQRAAVASAISYLEQNAAFVRLGKGGKELVPARLVVATFEHGSSRAADPQLHTHSLVLNIGVKPDGSTATLQSRYIFQHQMAAGALYRAELAAQLEQRVNLVAKRQKSCFEIKGVSKPLIDEFSKRRKEVEQRLEQNGYSSARASEIAALDTREVKREISRKELFDSWQEVGFRHGFSTPEVDKLTEQKAPRRKPECELAQALTEATARLTQHQSHFSKRELVRFVAEEAQGRGLGATEVRSSCESYILEVPDIVSLGEKRGELRYTTKDLLEVEGRLLKKSQNSLNNSSHIVPDKIIKQILTTRSTLADEQRAAFLHVSKNKGSIQLISGMAGTGKTYLLESAKDAWVEAGFEVYGAALAGKAASGLEQGAGIKSDTIHKTLAELNEGKFQLDKKTVLVVDEAGMVGTRQMEQIVTHTTRAGAKLVLVGDAKQLQPVDAGGPFKSLAEKLGQAELVGIRRQKSDWAKEAVNHLANGRADKALAAYAVRGLVELSETRHGARCKLINQWARLGVYHPADHLILAGTNPEVLELNRAAQKARLTKKELGEKYLEISGRRIFEGDRVLFTKNSRRHNVRNGQLGTVTEIRGEVLITEMDDGRRLPIPTESYEHIKLGYAVTTHKAQGATVEHAYILAGGPMQDRELSYVQASRARGVTRFFVDKCEAGEGLVDLVRLMKRSRQKDLAIDIAGHKVRQEQRI